MPRWWQKPSNRRPNTGRDGWLIFTCIVLAVYLLYIWYST
jgi:type VI protein secretion system component VasF